MLTVPTTRGGRPAATLPPLVEPLAGPRAATAADTARIAPQDVRELLAGGEAR